MTAAVRRPSGVRTLRLGLARALLAAVGSLRCLARRLQGHAHERPAGAAYEGAEHAALPADLTATALTPGAVFRGFVLKDLYFSRLFMLGAFAIAAAGVLLFEVAGARFAAFLAMFCSGAVPAAFLGLGIVSERQERSHLFALSLPISPTRYLLAKLLAASIAFMAPWTVIGAGTVLLLVHMPLGPGLLPYATLVWLFVLDQFCMLLAVAVASRSMAAVITAMVVFNLSPSLFFNQLSTLSITPAPAAVAVWRPIVLEVIAAELAAAALLLVLTLCHVFRQRDQA